MHLRSYGELGLKNFDISKFRNNFCEKKFVFFFKISKFFPNSKTLKTFRSCFFCLKYRNLELPRYVIFYAHKLRDWFCCHSFKVEVKSWRKIHLKWQNLIILNFKTALSLRNIIIFNVKTSFWWIWKNFANSNRVQNFLHC